VRNVPLLWPSKTLSAEPLWMLRQKPEPSTALEWAQKVLQAPVAELERAELAPERAAELASAAELALAAEPAGALATGSVCARRGSAPLRFLSYRSQIPKSVTGKNL
jgi:hypothetical protein